MIQEYFKDCRTEEELQKEHRRLVIQMHPDRNPDDPDATAKFQEMQAQYEERLAELRGDYRAGAKGRARRAQAERDEKMRREQERREREKRRVEEVLNQARKNRGVGFDTLKEGDYIYVRRVVDGEQSELNWEKMTGKQIVNFTYHHVPLEETVVKIEKIYDLLDVSMMGVLSTLIDDVYGGYEILQTSEFSQKGKRVAKVVMFRSEHYALFGNPKGDYSISDYYVPLNYEEMFADLHLQYAAEMKRQEEEHKRIEAENIAKLEAEQKSLIDEWKGKLISISAALTNKEKETVAMSNLKKMLKAKFPGVTFRFKEASSGLPYLRWEDGPLYKEVDAIRDLFCPPQRLASQSAWERCFGHVEITWCKRTMSTLVKATILEQLGQIVDAFATSSLDDVVEVDDVDWFLMHLLVGVNAANKGADTCPFVTNDDGKRMVSVENAVYYIFDHTSYVKKKKAAKRKPADKIA